jgi:hypothetical protein
MFSTLEIQREFQKESDGTTATGGEDTESDDESNDDEDAT